jgi:hypothetical protein
MSDIRPVALTQGPPEEPNNWRDRFVVIRKRLQIASLNTTLFVVAHKSLRMTALQTAGAAMALVGLALLFSAPVALVVGGIGAIVVAERQ